MSLVEILKNRFNEIGEMTRDEAREFGNLNKYDVSTTDRKLRELTQKGFIEPIEGNKGFNIRYKKVKKQVDWTYLDDKLL